MRARPKDFYITPKPTTKAALYKAGKVGGFQPIYAFEFHTDRATTPEDTAINDAMWELFLLRDKTSRAAEAILQKYDMNSLGVRIRLEMVYE